MGRMTKRNRAKYRRRAYVAAMQQRAVVTQATTLPSDGSTDGSGTGTRRTDSD
jgi:hypothetical protein